MWAFLRFGLTRWWQGRPRGGPMGRVPTQRVELLDLRGRRFRVRVPAFELDLHPVTNADWLDFCLATRHAYAPWMFKPGFSEPDQPVVGVTASEARTFARWARKRLPSEAEWVAAAGPGPYPWGEAPATAARAHFRSGLVPAKLAATGSARSGAPDLAVGVAQANPHASTNAQKIPPRPDGAGRYGHCDLVGLVWEHLARPDGQVGTIGRGGFWGSPDPHTDLRLVITDGERSTGIGFRCAR